MGFLTTHNAFRSSPPLLRKESSGCFTKPLILGAGGIDIAHELLLTAPVHTRIIELPPGTHAGLTLSSRGRGPGVTVSSLVMRDQAARCGLAIGDVILSIDGQPVHDPADGTRAIDSKRGMPCQAMLQCMQQVQHVIRSEACWSCTKGVDTVSTTAHRSLNAEVRGKSRNLVQHGHRSPG